MPYLEDGQEVEVLATFESGVVAQCVYEGSDFEPDPIIVKAVFDKPPTAKFDDAIARLKHEIDTLRARRDAARSEVDNIDAELSSVRSKLKESRKELESLKTEMPVESALKRVSDLLKGKITHYVYLDEYNMCVRSIESTERSAWSGQKTFALLTLHGDTKGNLAWHLESGRNFDGRSYVVHPCQSIEEAREIAKPLFEKKLREKFSNGYGVEDCLKEFHHAGIPVPPEIITGMQKRKEDAAKKAREEAAAKLAEAERALASVAK
jgi:hypothetical protein